MNAEKLTVIERFKIKTAIELKQIPDDVWPLLEILLQENEANRKKATDLAWKLEEIYANQEPKMSKLQQKLKELVVKGSLNNFSLENVSEDGKVGVKSKFRNTEKLTLIFPNDEKFVLGTFCSGSAEDTVFTLEEVSK